MPWLSSGEDDRRFKKSLRATLLIALLLGVIIPLVPMPQLPPEAEIELPERVVRFIELERRVLRIRKGQALVWAANLLHGGTPIQDPSRSRHSQVNHYFFEGCLYYQPQRSDPFRGRILWLDKRDIRTGRLIPQMYNGRPVAVRRSLGQRLKLLACQAGLDQKLRALRRK